jgi:hypothetical protein
MQASESQRVIIDNMVKMNQNQSALIDMIAQYMHMNEQDEQDEPVTVTAPVTQPEQQTQPKPQPKRRRTQSGKTYDDRITFSDLCNDMPEIQYIPIGTIYDAVSCTHRVRFYKYDLIREEFKKRGWVIVNSPTGGGTQMNKKQAIKWKRQIVTRVSELYFTKSLKSK